MKKTMVGMVLVLTIMLIFVACSGGAPAEEISAIDISDPKVFDEYVNINGSATPSEYSSEAEALSLEPFTQSLTFDFKAAANTEFSVLFNGEEHSINSGELTIDISEIDSGVYPITITTNAKVNKRRSQAQIWVQIDNGIIIPEIDLKWLEKDTAAFSFERDSDETKPATISIYLRTQEGVNGTKKTEVLLPANAETDVVLTGLTEEQSYEIGIRRNGEQETNWLASFRTFKSFEEGLQLFYWLDLTKPETHKVGVKIFGFYKGLDEVYLDNYNNGLAKAEDLSVILNHEIKSFTIQNDKKEVYFDFGNNQEGYFLFSYLSNKEYSNDWVNGAEGYFGEDYLMADHCQLLFGPGMLLSHEYGGLIDSSNFEAYMFLNMIKGWKSTIGWKDETFNLYSYPFFYSHEAIFGNALWWFFQRATIYAFKESEFYTKTVTRNNDFHLVITKDVGDEFDDVCDDIMLVYDTLTEIWDKEIYVPKYTLMITSPLADDFDHRVFGGEWDTGHGYSAEFGYVTSPMIHHLFNLWYTWAVGLPWNRNGFSDGLRTGFNEFYCGKLYKNLEFKTVNVDEAYENYPVISGYYRQYVQFRGTNDDLNLITDDHDFNKTEVDVANFLPYNKGCVYSFLMENEIKERTNNTKSLDNVLKHLWDQYDEDKTPGSYAEILDFLREEVPGGMDDWWRAYLLNNEPVYLYEFEENPPSFSVINPTPDNREEAVNQNITLSWEVDNPENKTLKYDLYINKLDSPEEKPMEPTYPGLDNPSKTLTLENGMKYIWRVKAYDNEGNVYMTPVWFFETD